MIPSRTRNAPAAHAVTPHRSSRPGRLAVRLLILGLLVAVASLLFAPPASALLEYSKEDRQAIAELPAEYREWLETVEYLITRAELDSFLELQEDYQRDAFIKRFWQVRDRYKDTGRNETQELFEERVRMIKQAFGDLDSDRAKVLLLNGMPTARIEGRCTGVLKPLEVWYYDGSDQVHFKFFVVFVRVGSTYRIWRPFDGIGELVDDFMGPGGTPSAGALLREVRMRCRDGDALAAGIAFVLQEGSLSYEQILGRIQETPDLESGEWVATFNSYTTDVPPGAPELPGELTVSYPGRRQSRTGTQGTVAIPRQAAGTAELADHRSYNFVLIGEVLQDGELFDNFRYKFDLPAADLPPADDGGSTDAGAKNGGVPEAAGPGGDGPAGQGQALPLVFQRYLRPGQYELRIKVEDLNSGAYFRTERTLEVPRVDQALPAPPQDETTAKLLAEANAALSRGETTLQIIPPQGELQTGYVRFDTLTTGDDIDRVAFALDGDDLLIKGKPPYSVDLDLGAVPQPRTLSAVAFGEDDAEVARDELLLNAGGNRFSVELVEPRTGKTYVRSLSADARVEVPEGETVEKVEFYVNETRVATLYQEPWVQPIVLPEEGAIAYVRAVAYLPDGNTTEDLVFVNAPDYLEELDVQFVELYASVVDRQGRPVPGDFSAEDFEVREDGVEQEIVRFEKVTDLPIHVTTLLDISASMEDSLGEAQQAALGFFQAAIEPKDRGSVVTFNDHPNLAVQFTNEVNELAGGLAGLKAERGTALYDSIIFSLYYFNGVKGQRALLILSDGKDEASRFTWEQALEYARRAGVTIYTMALRDDAVHKKLSRLADTTGGKAWRIQDPGELAAIYDEIERDLRSKYLIAYQSSNATDSKDFRSIEVEVDRPGAKVQTMQGYYP